MKRRGVVHDSNQRVLPQPRGSLAQVAAEHPGHRDLWIRQEPIQRLPVSHRNHLLGEAIGRLAGRQRHDPVQSLAQALVAQGIAVEFREQITHVQFGRLAHGRIRSQPRRTPPKKRS
jgi:hypothetical protein